MRLIKIAFLLLSIFTASFAYAVGKSPPIDLIIQRIDKAFADSAEKFSQNVGRSVGASVEVTAKKNFPLVVYQGGKEIATETAEKASKIAFSPTSSTIAKRFAGGVATNLVALALFDMLGRGVDYVMDPANNQVRFTDPDKLYYDDQGFTGRTPEDLAKNHMADGNRIEGSGAYTASNFIINPDKSFSYRINMRSGGYYMAYGKYGEQTKSLDEIAQHAKDMANNGNIQAQDGIREVVQDIVNHNEIAGSQYDNSTNITDNSQDVINNYMTNNYPNYTYTYTYNTVNNETHVTATPKEDVAVSAPASTTAPTSAPASTTAPTSASSDSKPFELPEFCSWATAVCDWQKWTKDKYKETTDSIKETYREVTEWFKDEPKPVSDDDETLKTDDNIDMSTAEKDYVSFPAYCPANPTFSLLEGTLTFPMDIVCKGVEMMKYVIIAFAYLKALFIVGNAIRS